MHDPGTHTKSFIEFFKVLLIFILIRIVMLETGVSLFHVPLIDDGITAITEPVKAYLKEYNR